MDAPGSGSDASDEQWDSPAEHGETSSSEECSSEEDEPCSDEEAEKVAALRYLHAPSVSEVFKKKPGRKRGVKLEPCATATDTEVACTRPQRQRARKATERFVAAGEGGLVYILFTHDESCFKAGDQERCGWVEKGKQSCIEKSQGPALHLGSSTMRSSRGLRSSGATSRTAFEAD